MFDRDIRPNLLHALRAEHPGAAVFEEFPICRKGRADVVAVNGAIWGYEIKSDQDTLNRLPIQIPYYECIFDFSVVVAAERHLSHIGKLIPGHWGMISVSGTSNLCHLVEVRKATRNANRNVDQIIRLLWKTEWIKILRDRGFDVRSDASVRKVWGKLSSWRMADLEEAVRSTLKARCATGSDSQQMSDDDSRTNVPIA